MPPSRQRHKKSIAIRSCIDYNRSVKEDWVGGGPTLGWLTKAKILREADLAEEILCDESEDGCQIKPIIRKDPRTGQRVGVYFCGQNEDVGRITVNLDRMRQWAFSLAGLAALVAKASGTTGEPAEPEPGWLVMLGTARLDGQTRELFLARGAAWQDAAQVFGNCSRLKMAAHAAVLTLVAMPQEPLLAGCELAVRPLAKIASVHRGKLRMVLDGAFPEVRPGPWAEIPNEPITLDDFMATFCEKREKTTRKYRRDALLAAARNGTIEMPAVAGSFKSGQSYEYLVHDLLKVWQGFLDENVDLPPLLPQYRTSPLQQLPAVH